ncbi:MAG: carboxypeptidase-like regulatory domain-containing protein, partial [Runella zeae]
MNSNSVSALAGRVLKKIIFFSLCLAFWGPVFARKIPAPKQIITGKVIDGSTGEALPGVNVLVEGTTLGTATNAEGKYSIEVANTNAVLVFSYVGYTLQKISVAGKSIIDVKMEADLRKLEEVVVVGYGSQKKGDITGAISSITSKALKEVPVTNAPQMLQGRAAGVYVLNTGNKPGAGVSVQIRGRRSFSAGNDPLYVVDGIPISGGFNDINPGDIEAMEILKDASATAIYGSRGANGVIIISTKRGKSGSPVVSYNTYYGASRILRYADVMNGEQFAEFKRESRRAVINSATGRPLYDDADPQADAKLFEAVELESITQGRYTDWQRLMVKNGNVQNHELGVSGGTENTKFNVATGY